MSLFGSFFRNRKKETCPNCGKTVRHDERMLTGGKPCCIHCYKDLKKAIEDPIEKRRKELKAAPVFTEIRNGFVHQYSTYSVVCGECGKTLSCRSDDIPRKYEDFEGKRYCRDCWEKKEKELTDPCIACGRPVSRYDRRVYGRLGYCTECWPGHMAEARERYIRYEKTLLGFLAARGIAASGSEREGLLPSGQPAGYVGFEERNHDMIRLRKSEYAVSDLRVGKGWFAIPESGSRLRYIKPSPDGKLMEFLAGIDSRVLAAVTWNGKVAVLEENGTVRSTDPALDGEKVYEKQEKIGQIAKDQLGEEGIAKAREPFLSGGIHELASRYFYDSDAKVFFTIVTDGNYYHGYDVHYPVLKREEVIKMLSRFESVRGAEEAGEKGSVPMSVIAEGLEDSGKKDYAPPDGFGYGTYYV